MNVAAKIDKWIMKQADNYWHANDIYDCQEEDDYEEDCGECPSCKARAKEEYEEARADEEYDRMRERQLFGI